MTPRLPAQNARPTRRVTWRLGMATLLLVACQREPAPAAGPDASIAPTPSPEMLVTVAEPTLTPAIDTPAPSTALPTVTWTPAPTAMDALPVEPVQSEALSLTLVEAARDFTGQASEVFNASNIEAADMNGNGHPDILVALDHATCAAEVDWPCLTAVEWDGAAYTARAVVAQPRAGVAPGVRPERYEGYLATSTSGTAAGRVWLSIAAQTAGAASGLYALVGGSDSPALQVESYTPLFPAPQALWPWVDEHGRSGVVAATWDTTVTSLTQANVVQWITNRDPNVERWSKDSTAVLYVGALPGLEGTYLLQEHIFTTRANDVVAYRLEDNGPRAIDNPLPVGGSLKCVYRGKNVLGSADSESLVLLRTETRCALGNPNLCALDVDPVVGDQAVDFIEVYDRVEGAYVLRARVRADPEQRPVYRLILGDLDGDGQDEIITSNGILYEWKNGQAFTSRSLEEAGQARWTYWVEADGTETLHAPLGGCILDVDGDGRLDLAFLVIVVRRVDSTLVETTSLFVATFPSAP